MKKPSNFPRSKNSHALSSQMFDTATWQPGFLFEVPTVKSNIIAAVVVVLADVNFKAQTSPEL